MFVFCEWFVIALEPKKRLHSMYVFEEHTRLKSYFGSPRSSAILFRNLQSSEKNVVMLKFAFDRSSNEFIVGFLFSCCRFLNDSDW
jgi:hypothetical protein